MTHTTTAIATHRRLLTAVVRLVAGDSTWGWLDVWPSRYGFAHYRLVVCPPGTTTTERTMLRLWHAWPAILVVTGGLAFLAAGAIGLTPIQMTATAAGGAVTVLLVLAHATRLQRPLVHVRFGGTEDVSGSSRYVGDMDLIDRSWTRLTAADRAHHAGEITALEHELVWIRAWGEVARSDGPRRRG